MHRRVGVPDARHSETAVAVVRCGLGVFPMIVVRLAWGVAVATSHLRKALALSALAPPLGEIDEDHSAHEFFAAWNRRAAILVLAVLVVLPLERLATAFGFRTRVGKKPWPRERKLRYRPKDRR